MAEKIKGITDSFKELEKACKSCEKCGLCTTRNNVVFGVGNTNA